MVCTWLGFVLHSPSESRRPTIEFLLCLWVAQLWKIFVFLPPCLSHWDRERCLHIHSSFASNMLTSLRRKVIGTEDSPCIAFSSAILSS